MKPIAIVAHDQRLVDLKKQLSDAAEHYTQRREFLKKQIDDLVLEGKRVMTPVMDKVTDYLIKMKRMPPDYNPNKHHIHFDDHGDVIYLCDGPV